MVQEETNIDSFLVHSAQTNLQPHYGNGVSAMFTFQLDNTRSKHCRHPLAVMGVVVYFRAQYYSNNTSHGRCKKNKILRWNGLTYIIETLEIPWAHRTWTICQKVWVKVCKSLRRRTTSNQLALPPAAHAELGTELRSVCPFVVQSKLKAAGLMVGKLLIQKHR